MKLKKFTAKQLHMLTVWSCKWDDLARIRSKYHRMGKRKLDAVDIVNAKGIRNIDKLWVLLLNNEQKMVPFHIRQRLELFALEFIKPDIRFGSFWRPDVVLTIGEQRKLLNKLRVLLVKYTKQ